MNSRLFERAIHPMRCPGPPGPQGPCLGSRRSWKMARLVCMGAEWGRNAGDAVPFWSFWLVSLVLVVQLVLALLGGVSGVRAGALPRAWIISQRRRNPCNTSCFSAPSISSTVAGPAALPRPGSCGEAHPQKPTVATIEPKGGSFPASGGVGSVESGDGIGGTPCSGTRQGNFLMQATCRVLSLHRQGFSWHWRA